jgi:hypothetical protein
VSLTVSQLDSITIGPGIALPHTISDLDDDHAVVAAVKVSSAVGSGDEDLYIALVERSGDTLTVVDDDVLAQNMVTASASSLGPWSHRLPGAEKVVVLWWSRDAVGSGTWRLYARTVERAGWSLVLGPATLLYSGGILISLQSGPISSSRFVVWPDATTDYLVCDVAGTTISIAVSAAAPAGYRAASGQHVVVPLGDGERVLCRRSGANTELFVMEVVGTTVTFGAVHVLPADSLELTPDSGPEWVVTRTATTSLFYVTVAGTTITLDDDVTGAPAQRREPVGDRRCDGVGLRPDATDAGVSVEPAAGAATTRPARQRRSADHRRRHRQQHHWRLEHVAALARGRCERTRRRAGVSWLTRRRSSTSTTQRIARGAPRSTGSSNAGAPHTAITG